VDDLHARAGLPNDKMVQIHGDIFETRCSRCDFNRADYDYDYEHPPTLGYGAAGEQDGVPRCPDCGAMMRPGVVWFGEQLDPRKIDIVEDFLARGEVDRTFVVGTTALFGYIIDWAVRARGKNGELIEINPDETPLSRFATQVVREPAAIALPRLISEL
jgi:NAD-dependent deacetylase